MSIEFRYARPGEYPRISRFLDMYWAKNHAYVRMPQLFEWTFSRRNLWDGEGYSLAIAEKDDELVGVLGGIPFVFNSLGKVSRGVWLVSYVVRPDCRRGPTALRLLSMFRRSPYEPVIAFGMNSAVTALFRGLHAEILPEMPRHFVVLPRAIERLVNLFCSVYPDWPVERAEALARGFKLPDVPEPPMSWARSLPPRWNDDDWASIASQTVGAARDMEYLTWRYLQHPCFQYRVIAISEGHRTGLAIWRLETIRHTSALGMEDVDRIGRLVEFLPVSRTNARELLSVFWHELEEADACAADYYGCHGQMGGWLNELGFCRIDVHQDGLAIPSRFQPLDGRGGLIASALFAGDGLPSCSMDERCAWYWTKSDSDQDRPN
jgi:hypothetical protein